jgi:streptogramin lyase
LGLFSQKTFPTIHKLEDQFQQLGDRFQVVLNPMLEDSTGAIWIGTKNGLCKYSGSSIECFKHIPGNSNSIPGNDIENIVMDSKHRIWIAIKNKGIQIVDLQGNCLQHFQYKANTDQSLDNNRIWGMWEDETQTMWISYFTGALSSYNLNTRYFVHFDLNQLSREDTSRPKAVIKIIQDNEDVNIYWLFTTNGIVKWDVQQQDGRAFLFKFNRDSEQLDPLVKENSCNWIRSAHQDQQGVFWLGTFGHFLKFDTAAEEFQIVMNSEYSLKRIVAISQYSANELLISLPTGLALINKNPPYQVQLLKELNPSSKYSNIMGRFYEASNDCFYILNTSSNGPFGIYSICDQSNLINNKELGENIYRISATENYVHYYSNQNNSIRSESLENQKSKEHRFGDQNTSYIRYYHKLNNDSLLIATYDEVYLYHPLSGLEKQKELSNLISDRNESIFQDSKGLIWVGNQRKGLFKFEPSLKQLTSYSVNTSPALVYSDLISDIYEDRDGDIWISTEQGWSVYDSKHKDLKNYHNNEIQNTYGISLSDKVAIRQTNDGHIWIADWSFGILIWNKQTDSLIHKLELGVEINLSSINSMELDKEGRVWLLSPSAIVCVNPTSFEVKSFESEYGFIEKLYDLDLSNGGDFFIGHKNGFISFDPQTLLAYDEPPPKAIIKGFSIFDENHSNLLMSGKTIELQHNQNYISFDLGSINYKSGEQENYEVRLTPFDKNWIDLGEKRFKGYTNVPSGTYEFQLRVKTNNQNWTYSRPVSILIPELWYKSIWFMISSIVILGFLLYMFLNWRRQRDREKSDFEKQLAVLETKALRTQMNPHFLFNSLNSIRYQIVSNETQTAADYLTKFSRLIRLILQNSEYEYVKLSDELDLLELYVQMEKIRFKGSFDYGVSIEDSISIHEVLIPSMIIQPFVENAIIHGINPMKGMGKIELQILKKDGSLRIIIEDNGVGRTKSQINKSVGLNKKSLGMKITKDRISLLKKGNNIDDIIISDLYSDRENTGTRVVINLPFLVQDKSNNPITK